MESAGGGAVAPSAELRLGVDAVRARARDFFTRMESALELRYPREEVERDLAALCALIDRLDTLHAEGHLSLAPRSHWGQEGYPDPVMLVRTGLPAECTRIQQETDDIRKAANAALI